jgi:protein subunit release factor B
MSAIYLHPVQTPAELLLRDCEVRHERRRGPGGQHRNKTESAVVLKHLPTGVSAQAAERRSQHDNHRMAVKRLRINLALEVRSPELAEAAPTELWQSRRHEGRFGCSSDHEHFAPLLAEALDVVFTHQGQTPGSALQLGITSHHRTNFGIT